jgi:hypothetical protein
MRKDQSTLFSEAIQEQQKSWTQTPVLANAAFVKSANNKNIRGKRHKLALEADPF